MKNSATIDAEILELEQQEREATTAHQEARRVEREARIKFELGEMKPERYAPLKEAVKTWRDKLAEFAPALEGKRLAAEELRRREAAAAEQQGDAEALRLAGEAKRIGLELRRVLITAQGLYDQLETVNNELRPLVFPGSYEQRLNVRRRQLVGLDGNDTSPVNLPNPVSRYPFRSYFGLLLRAIPAPFEELTEQEQQEITERKTMEEQRLKTERFEQEQRDRRAREAAEQQAITIPDYSRIGPPDALEPHRRIATAAKRVGPPDAYE